MLLTEVIFQTDWTDVVGAVWVGVMGGGLGGGVLGGAEGSRKGCSLLGFCLQESIKERRQQQFQCQDTK